MTLVFPYACFCQAQKAPPNSVEAVTGYVAVKSPDGKYTAKMPVLQEDSKPYSPYLDIFETRSGKRVARWQMNGMEGFSWLPTRPHQFVVSGKLSIKTSVVAFWNGKSLRVLRQLNLPPKTDADAQFLSLDYVSKDGKYAFFREYDAAKYPEEVADRRSDTLIKIPIPER